MHKADWIALFVILAGVVAHGQMAAPTPPEPQSMDDATMPSLFIFAWSNIGSIGDAARLLALYPGRQIIYCYRLINGLFRFHNSINRFFPSQWSNE